MAPAVDVDWSKSSADPEEELRRMNAQRCFLALAVRRD